MNIKKAAFDMVVARLENDLQTVNTKIGHNKWDMKKLAEEQSILKRERGIITDTIWKLKNPDKTKKVSTPKPVVKDEYLEGIMNRHSEGK
jgi:hypothetical protein